MELDFSVEQTMSGRTSRKASKCFRRQKSKKGSVLAAATAAASTVAPTMDVVPMTDESPRDRKFPSNMNEGKAKRKRKKTATYDERSDIYSCNQCQAKFSMSCRSRKKCSTLRFAWRVFPRSVDARIPGYHADRSLYVRKMFVV